MSSLMLPSSLLAVLRSLGAESADRRAFLFLDGDGNEAAELGFGELDRRVRSVAAALDAQGARGERALLLFPPGLDFVVAFLGCLRAGVVAVPAYPPRPHRQQPRLQVIARDSGARFVLATRAITAAAERLSASVPELGGAVWMAVEDLSSGGEAWDAPDPEPDAPAFLQYTSGSTSDPKGVVVTHANLVHNEEAIRLGFGQSAASVVVGWLPLYHDMGLIGNVLQPLYAGATAVLFSPLAFLQRPRLWLEAIDRYRATTSGGPNFAYDLCVRKIGEAERAGLDLSSWSVAFNGAEPVRAETLERFSAAFASCGFRQEAFFPCYGLAEATLFVAGGDPAGASVVRAFRAEDLARHAAVEAAAGEVGVRLLVGCGRPSPGQRIAIVDPESGVPCPPGRVGEIWISGPSVAAGYWGRPEDSELLFRARTAGGDGPFLRTGDFGFVAADGELFVTGRLKDLIILRGRNVYPQDVERTAERVDPALRPGGGAAFSIERGGEERLVVVQEVEHGRPGAPEPSDLAEAVRRAVADEHEVAVEEVVLLRSGTLPKTSSGKVRRQACREGYLAGSLTVVGRSGPAAESDPPEESASAGLGESIPALVAAEAARVLRLDRGRLAPEAPLTGLGLDSLAAVELKAGVEARTGVALSLAGLLAGASLAAVEAEVLAGLAAARRAAVPGATPGVMPGVEAGPPLGEHPLSAGQEAIWFSDRLAPEAAVYNLAAAARVEGGLDPEALGRALRALADRHPALRTTFRFRSGEPRQIVHERLAVDFQVEPAVRTAADAPLAAEAYRPFDLERGPLLRVRIWPLESALESTPDSKDWLLLLAAHHLVTDFWSLGLLVRELAALYGEATGRGPAELAPLPLSYTDYVRWQGRILAGERGEELWDYWRRQLAGELPVLELATDRPRPAVQTYNGLARGLRLAPELADRLRALGRASGTTLFVTLLAGLQALLSRSTGQDEVVIGSPTAGREAVPFLPVMGYFVNPVALRLSAAGDPTWRELLVSARAVALAAFEHQGLPFQRVAERLRPERDPGRSPVFQALFVFQKAQRPEERGMAEFVLGTGGARIALADLTLVSVPLVECRAPFDLTLMMADAEAGLPAVLQLNRDLFDPATAERLLGHLANLLRALVEDPEGRVFAADMLSKAERRQLAAWNRTAVELPRGLCLPDLFAAQVERTPEREALLAGAERLTYRELDRRAGLLARRLRALGVGPEARVGVCARRSADLVAALLAVHRAGGSYVPLDPVQPVERLAWMLADSGAAVLLTEENIAPDLLAAGVPAGCRVVVLDPVANDQNGADTIPGVPLQPQNLAYLIYTSGSTGRPKGVAIEHRSAVTFVQWARRVFSDAELSGVLAATSIGFDLSVFEIFVPLAWGGRVILAENALALPSLPAAGEVRLINSVPSVLAELIRGEGLPGSVTTINLAGEPLPGALARALHEGNPAVRVLNLYGPSEDTTYSTFTVVPRGDERAPAIGLPIANTQAHLLDRGMRQVPVVVPGELLLGGEGLARGYHGRPDLTAERFVPDPFAPGARLYRTGDLARRRPDGELEFLGRIDDQVKIRGVRIEPAEVAAALLSLPRVEEAVVLALGEGSGDRRLIAYVVAEAGAEVDAVALRESLLRLLPRAMIPAAIVLLPGLPLTPNGKLDRRALARLAPEPAARAGDAEELRTPTEELLAGIWAEVLGIERVGPGDDFFALGGHSLLALRVQARLRERLGAELPLAAFFQLPTLAAQARRLAPGQADPRLPLCQAPPEQTVFPLSFAQARLWLLERLRPGTAVYHMAGVARLTGPLDAAVLGQALVQVARRHDALRARFREVDGAPVQEISPVAAQTRLPLVCLAGLDPARRGAEAERLSRDEARRPFDLTSEAPWRPLLVRLEPGSHHLLLTLHHIAADEDSLTILARELATLYGDLAAARPASLPELPLRAVDFALWQREWLRGETLDRQLAWWRDELADLPIVELPADRPRPEMRSLAGALVEAVLPPALAGALAILGRREGATLFMTLLAAFQVVLERTTGEPEVPVGCPVSSRDREPLLPLIGFFVNTLVLRGGSAAAPTFGGLLRRVREVTVQAHEHGDMPFELLVQDLRPERGLGGNPLFEVVFALQRPPRGWEAADLAFAPRTVHTGTAKFELTLFGVQEEGRLSLALEYATDLFDRPTPARLLGHLETLLAAAAADPARPLAELPLLATAERQQILEWGMGEESEEPAPVELERLAEGVVARGRPIVGVEARVLDRDLRPVAAGVPGELYLGGFGTPTEHLERPDLTAGRFLPDPIGGRPGARLFRTGERVRFRADGRIERFPLPRAVEPAAPAHDEPADGAGEAERIVAEVWREVLKVERVSPGDSFFGLGGHSLLLLPIQERLRQRSGVSVPIIHLLKYPTAGALARHLAEELAALRPAEPERLASIAPRTAGAGDPPASFAQEQLWFIDRLKPGSPVYNLPTAVRLDGALDRAALRAALAGLVERQAVLRTTLGSVGGRPIQVVAPRYVPPLPEVDLAALPTALRESAAARWMTVEALLPFDLAAGPLFRATLVRLEEDRHRLLVTFHHTVTDGWSLRLFYEELGALYASGAAGGAGETGLPALPIQYTDFAHWQRERLRGEVLERLLAYWRQRLAGAPAALEMPADRPRPPAQSYRGVSELLTFDGEAAQALRAFARDESATLFMALLAAYAALLLRYTGEPDLVLGTPTANRWHAELEPLIGFFANTMALRVDLSGDPTFRELLGRVRSLALADFAHQEMPFEKIVEELRPDRDLSHNPVYQVVFALETSARPDYLDLPGGLRVTPLPPTEGTAKFDLALYMDDRGGRLGGLFEVNRDLFDRATAVRWLGQFVTLAAAAVASPERRLSELPFLAPAESRQLLAGSSLRVKVRGYRVDLGRIEALLASHPAVAATAVAVRADRSGQERLVAYVTLRPGDAPPPAMPELRAFLGERLPEYMLPGAFAVLDAMPLTPEGELDRGALPALEELPERGAEPLPPADAAERMVVEVWQELLGIEAVGLKDNFFALGGRSLLLLPMQEHLERRFGVRVPVVDLFKFPSAGALAQHLSKVALASSSPVAAEPPTPERPAEQVRERAERTRAAVGRERFAEARRRVEATRSEPEDT
jgi:amino acid adenylation domain-containing protein